MSYSYRKITHGDGSTAVVSDLPGQLDIRVMGPSAVQTVESLTEGEFRQALSTAETALKSEVLNKDRDMNAREALEKIKSEVADISTEVHERLEEAYAAVERAVAAAESAPATPANAATPGTQPTTAAPANQAAPADSATVNPVPAPGTPNATSVETGAPGVQS